MKCVIVVDEALPRGLAANAAAALGLSLGAGRTELTGPSVRDGDGEEHAGITRVNLPILEAGAESLKRLYKAARDAGDPELQVIGFSTLAQRCRSYDLYAERMAQTPFCELAFSGICLLGPHDTVNRITGALPTLK